MRSPSNKSFDAWCAATLALRFFQPHELRFMGGAHYDHRSRAHGLNTLPPRELWDNIITAARVADMARAEMGTPIRILSAYRSPAYNRAIGGAKFSQHLEFCALDLTPLDGRVGVLLRILKRLRKEGHFTGGIGSYTGFVHIDNRGHNVDF
jgi:lysozyme